MRLNNKNLKKFRLEYIRKLELFPKEFRNYNNQLESPFFKISHNACEIYSCRTNNLENVKLALKNFDFTFCIYKSKSADYYYLIIAQIKPEFQKFFEKTEIFECFKKHHIILNFKPIFNDFEITEYYLYFKTTELIELNYELIYLKKYFNNEKYYKFKLKPGNNEIQYKLLKMVNSFCDSFSFDFEDYEFKIYIFDPPHDLKIKFKFELKNYNSLDEFLTSILFDYQNLENLFSILKLYDNFYKKNSLNSELSTIILKLLKQFLFYNKMKLL